MGKLLILLLGEIVVGQVGSWGSWQLGKLAVGEVGSWGSCSWVSYVGESCIVLCVGT